MQVIKQWLTPPVFKDDPVKTGLARYLHVMTWSTLVMLIFYAITLSLWAPQLPGRNKYLLIMVGVNVVVLIWTRHGQIHRASIATCLGLWALLGATTYISGGVRSAPFYGNILIILNAAILLGRNYALAFAVLSLVEGMVFVWVETNGGLPPLSTTPVSALLTQTAYFMVGAGSFYLATFSIREALDRAQHELLERRQAEEALRESEQTFRSFIEQSSEGFTLVDERGIVIEWNQAQEQISGRSRQEALGMTLWEIQFHSTVQERRTPENYAHLKAFIQSMLRTGEIPPGLNNNETGLTKPNGQQLVLQQTVFPIKTEKGFRLGGVARDITERQSAEKALRESEEKYRSLVESFPDIILVYDLMGKVLYANAALEKQTGYTREDFGPPKNRVYIHPEDIDLVENAIRELLSSDKQQTEIIENRFIDKSGRIHWYSGIIARTTYQGQMALQIITRDITDRKLAEQEIQELNARLEQRVSERTAELEAANQELEAYAYSVSHDLRAPLRAIAGYSHLLEKDYVARLDEDGRFYLRSVSSGVRQMSTLIDDLLEFSRLSRQPVKAQAISAEDLPLLVTAVFESLCAEQKDRRITLTVGELPACYADPTLIKQVFVNLLSNAIKYTRPRAEAVIQVGSLEQAGKVVYFVRDNGVGFDMRYADRLFGAFQRLHLQDEFEGTGVGLATVQRIIQRHGGKIWAEAAVDQGATFYFALEPGT